MNRDYDSNSYVVKLSSPLSFTMLFQEGTLVITKGEGVT